MPSFSEHRNSVLLRCAALRYAERGAGNQQWTHTSCAIYRNRKTLRENRPHLPRTALRGRRAILNLLTTKQTTHRWRLPPPPRPLPLLRGQARGQRRISRLRRALGSRWGVKLAWSQVGSAHLARRLLTGVAHNTPGSTPQRLTTAFRVRGESLGAQELHLPYLDRRATPFQCGRPQRPGLLVS